MTKIEAHESINEEEKVWGIDKGTRGNPRRVQ
jgi:hypothetical protein